MNFALVSTGLGLLLLSSPLPWQQKTMVAIASSAPGLVVVVGERRKYKDVIAATEEAQQRLADLDQEIVKGQVQMTAITQQWEKIDEERRQVKLEAKGILDAAQEEAQKWLQSKQAEIDLRLSQLTQMEADVSAELVQAQTKLEASKQAATIIIDGERQAWELERSQQKKILEMEIAQALAEIEGVKVAIADERKHASDMWEAQKQREIAELVRAKEELQAEFDGDRRIWDMECDRQKREINSLLQNIDQEKLLWQQQKQKDFEAFQVQLRELEEESALMLAKENEAYIKQEIQARLVPHLKEMGRLQSILSETREKLRIATERLEEMNRPKKFNSLEPHYLMGDRVIDFFESRGVMVDGKNAYINSQGLCVRIKPWDGVQKADIKKHFDSMVWELGLQEPPQLGICLEGFELLIKPASMSFMGLRPDTRDAEDIKIITPPGYRDEFFEPDTSDADTEAARSRLAAQMNQEKWMSFAPPQRKMLGKGEITQLEKDWIYWLYKWRSQATGGHLSNITNQNDLIEEVYGVKPGRATDVPDPNGDSLRSRLHSIMDELSLERRKRK